MPHHLRTDIADELASFIVTVCKQRIILTFYSDSSFHSHAPEDANFSKYGKSLFTVIII